MTTKQAFPKHLREAIDTEQWDTIPQVIENTLTSDPKNQNPDLMITMGFMLRAVKQSQYAIDVLSKGLAFQPTQQQQHLIYEQLTHHYTQLHDYTSANKYGLLTIQTRDELEKQNRPSKNLVAFSLYGSKPVYCEAVILNAQAMPNIYPNWQMVVYHDDSVPSHVLDRLAKLKVELVNAKDINASHMPGTFWRFLALERDDADVVIMRDADSIINEREKALVEDWLTTNKPFHLIRDWYSHTDLILAGLWGARMGLLGRIRTWIDQYLQENPILHATHADQFFLASKIWGRIKDFAVHHSSMYQYGDSYWISTLPKPYLYGDNTNSLGSRTVSNHTVNCTSDYLMIIKEGNTKICQYMFKAGESFELPSAYYEKLQSKQWVMNIIPIQINVPNDVPQSLTSEQIKKLFDEAMAFYQTNDLNSAKNSYEQVLKNQPQHLDALTMLGIVNFTIADYSQALALFNQALDINSQNADLWNNKGSTLINLGRTAEAIICFEKALQINPNSKIALQNLGNQTLSTYQLDKSIACFEHLIEIDKQDLDSYKKLIRIFHVKRFIYKALQRCNEALALFPTEVYFYFMKANMLRDLRQYETSITFFEKTLALDPDYPEALGFLISSKAQIGDWENFNDLLKTMQMKLKLKVPVAKPFFLLLNGDFPQEQLFCTQSFLQRNQFIEQPIAPFKIDYNAQASNRIKVAYLSADFHHHATAILMAELFELHDKSRFEIYAYSYGQNRQDIWRTRLENAFEHFYEVSLWSDEAIAKHIHTQQISIAIDLKGYTGGSRTGIFTRRPAPIQINYIGYPGTMGASFIDYIIADNTLIPQHLEKYYTEKIIKLPHTYQPNDRHRKIADTVPSKQQVGLPDTGFVYCCFNNPFKILPETFAVWMRILHAVPNSVLWVLKDSAEIERNLRNSAKAAGIDPQRLIFAEKMPLPEHLARHALADLFLDTLPYNAHTTTSDALWAGLPVLTCMGQSFASRVAGSLLHACGMDELITESMTDYEKLAIELGKNSKKINKIKQKLRKNRDTSPLFDTPRYTKNLETAFEQIFALAKDGKMPQTLTVTEQKPPSE